MRVSERRRPVTALASRRDGLELAAGTELDGSQAVITLWWVYALSPYGTNFGLIWLSQGHEDAAGKMESC